MVYEDYVKLEKLKKQYCVTGNCLDCFYNELSLAWLCNNEQICPLTEIKSKLVVENCENKIKYNIQFAAFPASDYYYRSIHVAKDKLKTRYKNKMFISRCGQWEDITALYKDYYLLVNHLAELSLLEAHKRDGFYIIEWSDKL